MASPSTLSSPESSPRSPSRSDVPSATPAIGGRGWTVFGALLWCVGVAALARQLFAPIDVYDEGLVLTHADHVLHGLIPYRDFYSNYPPGVFVLVAAVWKVTGESVLVERAVGLALHVALALLAGRLAARAVGSARARSASWLASGAVFVWLRHGPIWPTAWMLGLVFVCASFALALEARESRARWFVAGLALGLAGCARHDLFVYTCAVGGVAYAFARWRAARAASVNALASTSASGDVATDVDAATHEFPPRRVLVALIGGVAIPLVLTWGWIAWKAGVRQPVLDLYSDQTRYVLPGRVLPLPAMWKPGLLSIAIWIELLAPVLALSVFVRGGGSRSLALLVVLAVAALPQMMGRTDDHHVMYVLTPGLAILAVVAVREVCTIRTTAMRSAAMIAVVALVCGALYGLRFRFGRSWTAAAAPRADGMPARDAESAAARDRVLAFVAEHTRPDERIFVGNDQHERVFVNDMDLYYLSDRRGAVRRMQFDPNVTNREDEQLRMIREIDAHGTNVVVLGPSDYPVEPNDSRKTGSDLFDRWLRDHFREVERVGGYRMLVRSP